MCCLLPAAVVEDREVYAGGFERFVDMLALSRRSGIG
jgi:hypothetical protein